MIYRIGRRNLKPVLLNLSVWLYLVRSQLNLFVYCNHIVIFYILLHSSNSVQNRYVSYRASYNREYGYYMLFPKFEYLFYIINLLQWVVGANESKVAIRE